MAKKEKLKGDDFDFDLELDFDNFDESRVDKEINPDIKKKGSRKVVSDVYRGTIAGAKSKATDPGFIKSMAKKAMPSTFGEIVDAGDKVAGTWGELYDQADKEIKPQLRSMARRVDKIIPPSATTAKKLSSKFAALFGVDQNSATSAQATKEQVQDQSIAIGLGQIFAEQQINSDKAEAVRKANTQIQDSIRNRQFQSSLSVLTSMDKNISRLTQYNEKINQAVQKKSIELQYRQLFAMKEMVDTNKQYFEIFKNQFEGIARNTSLPEFVKISNSERFKDLARTKFMDKVQNSFFGEGTAIDRGLKKMQKDIGAYIGGLKNGLESASMGLDGLEQVKELNEQFVEMGMAPITGAELAGNAAGGFLAEKIGSKVTDKIRKRLEKNKKLNDALYKTAGNLKNFSGTAKDLQHSDKLTAASIEGGAKGAGADAIDKILGYFLDNRPDGRVKNTHGSQGLEQPAIFDKKAHRALVDVIPGYLARIDRGITVLRTGDDKIGLTVFDHQTGKFVSQKEMGNNLIKKLGKDIKLSGYGYVARNVGRKFTEGESVSDDDQKKVDEFLSKLSTVPNMSFTPENIVKTAFYKELDAPTQKLVRTILDKKITNSDEKEKGQYELKSNLTSLRNQTTDVRGAVEAAIKNGYGKEVEEQGLAKRLEDGDYDIDVEKVLGLVREHSGLVTSDETAKKDIKPISGKSALDSIRRLGIFNWKYKPGKGDGKIHNGPMAQDVKNKLGDGAAPDGRKLDLTTMNGNNMAAIQELANQVDGLRTKLQGKARRVKRRGQAFMADDPLQKAMNFGQETKQKWKSKVEDLKENDPHVKQAMAFGEKVKKQAEELQEQVRDVYVKGMEHPTIKANILKAGGYRDLATGKIISTIEELRGAKGNIVDENNEVVLTDEDAAKGLHDQYGTRIKTALEERKQRTEIQIKKGFKELKGLWEKLNKEKEKKPEALKKVLELARKATSGGGRFMSSAAGTMNTFGSLLNAGGSVAGGIGKFGSKVGSKLGIFGIPLTAAGLALQGAGGLAKLGGGALKLGGKPLGHIGDAVQDASTKDGEYRVNSTDGLMRRLMGRYHKSDKGVKPGKPVEAAPEHATPEHAEQAAKGGFLKNLWAKGKEKALAASEAAKQHAEEAKNNLAPKAQEKLNQIREKLSVAPEPASTAAPVSRRESANKKRARLVQEKKDQNKTPKQKLEEKIAHGKQVRSKNLATAASVAVPSVAPKSMMGKALKFGAGIRGGIMSKGAGLLSGASGLLGRINSGAHGAPGHPEEAKHQDHNEPEQHHDDDQARDPKRRQGSWMDRLNAQKKADDAARAKKVDNTPDAARYMPGQGVGSAIKDALGPVGDLLGAAKSVLGMATTGGGLLMKIGGGLGKLLSFGGKALGIVGGPIGKVLGGVGTATQAVGRMAGLGRLAGVAGMVRNVATVGALATGGAGSVVMGALSAGLSLVGAVVSSPVVLGAVAVAAVGYGAYKLYKYMNRDNVDDFEKIRMQQYGIGTGEADKKFNHFMLVLEAYLNDGRVGYNQGQAYLLDKKIDSKELLDMFSIDKDDTEGASKFSDWFQRRFKPFYLTHKTALFAVDNKANLEDVKKLKPEEQLKYLSQVSFDSGPYKVDTSPFKDLERLNTDKDFALNSIKNLIKKISADAKIKVDTKASPDKVNKAVKPPIAPIKPPTTDALPKTDVTANKEANKALVDQPGEDGPMKIMSPTLGGDQGVSKADRLKIADGPIRDGTTGMQYIKMANGVNIDSMNPTMLKNLLAMAQEYGEKTGKAITITSGTRTTAEQAELYRKNPKKAAPPGRSMHEFGLAVDVSSGDLNMLDDMGLMRKYGFTRPVGGEPWHMEAAGVQVNVTKAKDDPNFASEAIASSLFKGGGGVGSIAGSPLGKRDSSYAISLFDDSASSVKDKVNNIADGTLKQNALPTVPAANDASDGGMQTVKVTASKADVAAAKADMPSVTVSATKEDVRKAKMTLADNSDSSKYSKSNNMPDTESSSFDKVSNSDSGSDSGPFGDIKSVIAKSSNGVEPKNLQTFAAVESSLDPNARAGGNGTSKGLFGFTDDTWNYRLQKTSSRSMMSPNPSPLNPTDATLLASDYYKSNAKFLSKVKSDVNVTDVYLAHFLGPGGARKFLSADSDDIAANVVPEAAAKNRAIFFNGGRPRTIGEVYKFIDDKLVKKAREFGINLSGGNSLTPKKQAYTSKGISFDGPDSTSSVTTSSGPKATTPMERSNTQSTQGYVDRSSAPQASRTQVAPVPPTSIAMDGGGRSSSAASPLSQLSSIDDTLAKSLGVQREMDVKLGKILAAILKNGGSVPTDGIAADPKKPAPTPQQNAPQKVESAVNLSRRA